MNKPIYLYITPFFPSPKSWVGGYCLDAVKAIIHDGRYDVRVLATGNGEDYEWDGIKIYRLCRKELPCGVAPFFLNSSNNRQFRAKLSTMGINLLDVAVCHANTLVCGSYAAYFKTLNPKSKTIIQFHSCYSFELASGRLGILPLHATFLYLYYRKIIAKVDILAFVSNKSRMTFGKRYVDTPEGAIKDVRSLLWVGKLLPSLKLPKQVVVYNGVDKLLFFPKPRQSHNGFTIGCVANFQPLKDHITLLRAVNILKYKIKGLKVRLIGSGVMLKTCMKYVETQKLCDIVTFEKEIDHRDLPDCYRSFDLLVLPSRLEGFPCVCIESWACGTPAIFCENISLAEIVPRGEKSHWLFAPLDVEDLAHKIECQYTAPVQQHFTRDLDINGIWKNFLDEI